MGTETAMPSGMLWMAMAATMGMATLGDWRAETKVASPSGKLWMAMARAVSTPTRMRLPAWRPSSASSMRLTSCGFSAEGMSLSMMAMTSMPPKKPATVIQLPRRRPSWAVRASLAWKKSSTRET